MPESLLTVLKFCFLALVYLFLARVVRVVMLELKSEKVPTGPVLPAPAQPVAAAVPTSVATASATAAASRRGRGAGSALQVIVAGPYEAEIFPLDDEMTVGRAPGCGVVLTDDTFVSQVHARVFRRNRRCSSKTSESTNGTLRQRRADRQDHPASARATP